MPQICYRPIFSDHNIWRQHANILIILLNWIQWSKMSAPNVSPSLDQHVVNGGRGRHRRPLGGLWHAFKHKFKFFYMKFLICLLLVYPIREVRGYLRIRIRHHHYGRWSTRLGAAAFVVSHWNKIYFYSIVYLKKKTLSKAEVGWIP